MKISISYINKMRITPKLKMQIKLKNRLLKFNYKLSENILNLAS